MSQQFPMIESEHLIFRKLTYDDAEGVFQLFSDPETMKYDGGLTMKQSQEAYHFIHYFSQPPQQINAIRWAIVAKSSRQFLGTAGFHNLDRENQSAELGGELTRQFWKKGIGTEGYLALISFAFREMGLNRVYALVNSNNLGAKRIMEQGIFKKEGYLRECRQWNGKFVDMELYALLKKDWLQNK